MTDVSILICTCNRAQHLRQTLDSMSKVSIPETFDCELLVVDNGSTDETEEVVKATSIPRLSVRYLHEARRGKGYAYHTGMAAAKGNIFLFTDDDLRLPQDWIAGMCAPILSGRADGVVGGVKIAPHLERDWMEPIHRGCLASTMDYDAADPPILIGANMAFSKTVLTQVPFYDLELGPGALGLCDDSLFSYQLKEAGYRLCAVLNVVAEHHFEAKRLLRANFLEIAQKLGRSTAYIDYHWEHKIVAHPHRRLVELLIRRVLHTLRKGPTASDTEGIPFWEFSRSYDISYYQQWIKEKKRARNYVHHGLVKRDKAALV